MALAPHTDPELAGVPKYPSGLARTCLIVASIAVGFLSYRFVESPFRRGTEFSDRQIAIGALATTLLIATLGIFTKSSPRFAQHNQHFNTPRFSGNRYDGGRYLPEGGLKGGTRERNPTIVVIGSSHALMHSSTIDQLCKDLGEGVVFLSKDATEGAITGTETNDFNAKRLRIIQQLKPKVIIWSDPWSECVQPIETSISQTLKLLPSNTQLLLLDQIPLADVPKNLVKYVNLTAHRNGPAAVAVPESERSRLKTLNINERLRSICSREPRTLVVSVHDLFSLPKGKIRFCEGTTMLYKDSTHLSDDGAALVRTNLLHAIQTCLQRS